MSLWLGVALAQVHPSDRAHYLMESGRPEQGLLVAVEAIEADADDIAAHRAYVSGMRLGLRSEPQVRAIYEDWVGEEPGNPVPRVALAQLIVWTEREPGPWCEQVDELTRLADVDPSLEYYRHRVRYEAVAQGCAGDLDAELEAILALGPLEPRALGYALRMSREEPVTAELAASMGAWWAERPQGIDDMGLWFGREGEGLPVAQARATEIAFELMQSDEPLLVEAAWRLFVQSSAPEADMAFERLLAVDPGYARPQGRDDDEWELLKARWESPAWRAASRLRALEPTVSETARPLYDELYAEAVHDSLLRAGAARRAALESNPLAFDVVDEFAYHAAWNAEDIPVALAAIDRWLAEPAEFDPAARGAVDYDAWRVEQARMRATLLDHRGWLLARQGQVEQGVLELQRAVLLHPEPEGRAHLRLGLLYAELGREEEALRHLARGLSLSDRSDSDNPHVQRARRVARRLYEGRRWSSTGLDGYVAAHAPDLVEVPLEETEDYRVGQPFPDLELTDADGSRPLSSYEGVVVVDLWATWCGPCITSLPALSQVARDYEGRVTVLAVSVDGSTEDLADFGERPRRPAYTEVWAGPDAMEQARVTAIPTTFVLVDGVVEHHHRGSGGDRALREALDEALAQ